MAALSVCLCSKFPPIPKVHNPLYPLLTSNQHIHLLSLPTDHALKVSHFRPLKIAVKRALESSQINFPQFYGHLKQGALSFSVDPQSIFACLGESISRASLLALLSASLCFASDPALAFKGGGPYGTEVTRGQDLSGKDFSGRNLIKQDFKTSILRQAKFKGATLVGASFFDADLTGADLSDADLRNADFSLASVTKANLTNANLEGALATGNTSFRGSIITGADFTDVPLRDDQREYLCKVADGVNPTTGNATRDTLFCK